jgi:hypothetical protein
MTASTCSGGAAIVMVELATSAMARRLVLRRRPGCSAYEAMIPSSATSAITASTTPRAIIMSLPAAHLREVADAGNRQQRRLGLAQAGQEARAAGGARVAAMGFVTPQVLHGQVGSLRLGRPRAAAGAVRGSCTRGGGAWTGCRGGSACTGGAGAGRRSAWQRVHQGAPGRTLAWQCGQRVPASSRSSTLGRSAGGSPACSRVMCAIVSAEAGGRPQRLGEEPRCRSTPPPKQSRSTRARRCPTRWLSAPRARPTTSSSPARWTGAGRR